MSVAPPPNPAAVAQETRRARLAVLAATVGIAAMLFAYAIAPGVRHAVSHAAHSVKHAVGHVFDPDSSHSGHRSGTGAASRTASPASKKPAP